MYAIFHKEVIEQLNKAYKSISIIGVSAKALRNWDSNGKLHPHHTTTSGYRYYSDEQLNQVMNVKPKTALSLAIVVFQATNKKMI